MRPKILICNDDGVESPFLTIFVGEFCKVADVTVVVPANEQSWIGRAYSRHRVLELKEHAPISCAKCFTIDGTPADCVNIALSGFLEFTPDAVVSGLNIGQNIALPLLWSSGTFAGAVEGAGRGIAAFALSQQIKKEYYDLCRLRHQPPPDELAVRVADSSKDAAAFELSMLEKKLLKFGDVCNVNYPSEFKAGDGMLKCLPARVGIQPLYERNAEGKYAFKYACGEPMHCEGVTDVGCLKDNRSSYSVINIYGGVHAF